MRYCPLRDHKIISGVSAARFGLCFLLCIVSFVWLLFPLQRFPHRNDEHALFVLPLRRCHPLRGVCLPRRERTSGAEWCHCGDVADCLSGWTALEGPLRGSVFFAPDEPHWGVRCETTKICRRRPLRGGVIIVVIPGEKAKNIFPFPRKSDAFYEYSV